MRHKSCPLPVLMAGLVFAAAAVPAAERFTAQHVAKLRMVTAAKISPDGSSIAYVLSVPRRPGVDENGPAYAELHVVGAGGESRPYVTGPVTVGSVGWTPDGSGISYLAKREGDKEASLYVIPLAGGESRRYFTYETSVSDYSWSPDGTRLAFLAVEPESKALKESKEKGFSQEVYEEDLPRVRVGIVAADPDAEEAAEPRFLELPGTAASVKWSPAGAQLAVALAPTPTVDDGLIRLAVHIVEVETGQVAAKLDHPAKLGDYQWSPDGANLATISGEDAHDPRDGRLLLWSAAGGLPKDLAPGYEGHVAAVEWKDRDTLLFVGSEGVQTALREVTIAGARIEVERKSEGVILHSLSLSKDGSAAAMVAEAPEHPSEVYGLKAPRRDFERRTSHNDWLEGMAFAKQEVVRYLAEDGLEIEGILVRPLEEEAGKRYPLILAVHGGPEASVPNGWVTSYSSPGQVAASAGMAVFYPNYRGSTGRGVAFSKMGQADAAGPEFRDLIDAIDHLVETGLADGDKVGITGGSYGGYASAWGATYYSERFAASVMFVGISDNISKLGTTDIPDEMYLVHHRKRLWEDWDYFLERSPIRHVEKARTPLLILHGKADPRVHPSQSLELHRHLKTLGQAPVRLVLYPGEGHGNRRAASRLDYNLRMMRWMEHYLKGPGGEPPPYAIDYGLKDEEGNEAGDDSAPESSENR